MELKQFWDIVVLVKLDSLVMSMIYYLGYAQYNGGVSKKAKHLSNIFFKHDIEQNSEQDSE